MIADVVLSKACFGCGACEQKCPKDAIIMQPDEEGFLVPVVNASLCVECGLCRKVCQALHSKKYRKAEEGKHFIVQNRSSRKSKRSASGGAFIGMACYVLDYYNGVVFGCVMSEDNKVRHIKAENTTQLYAMQNSKYVQSTIGQTYKEVAEYLSQKRVVLFSGTPCQVSGLYQYLQREDENLITIDIICHGTPSPLLFHTYLDVIQKKYGKIKSLKFRYKNPYFKSISSFLLIVKFRNGKSIAQKPYENPYFNVFLNGWAFREVCYTCPYAQINRYGDFTIGDCDSHSLYPRFHPKESNSTLMLNSQRAKRIWEEGLKDCFEFAPLDINKEATRNKQLKAPFKRPDVRDVLYLDLKTLSFADFSSKYSKHQSMKSKVQLRMALICPPVVFRIKAFLHKLLVNGK